MKHRVLCDCSANTNATFSLFGLCLSDVIDVDIQQQQRRFESFHVLTLTKHALSAFCTSTLNDLSTSTCEVGLLSFALE